MRKEIFLVLSFLGCGQAYQSNDRIATTWTLGESGDYKVCSVEPKCDFGYRFDLGTMLDDFEGAKVVVSSRASNTEMQAARYMKERLGCSGIYSDEEVDLHWNGNYVLVGTYENNERIKDVMFYAPRCAEDTAVLYGVRWRNHFSTLVLLGDKVGRLRLLAENFSADLPVFSGRKSVTLEEVLCSSKGAHSE